MAFVWGVEINVDKDDARIGLAAALHKAHADLFNDRTDPDVQEMMSPGEPIMIMIGRRSDVVAAAERMKDRTGRRLAKKHKGRFNAKSIDRTGDRGSQAHLPIHGPGSGSDGE